MDYTSASDRASNFEFEIMSPITPEFYDAKSYYQLIESITKIRESQSCKYSATIHLDFK